MSANPDDESARGLEKADVLADVRAVFGDGAAERVTAWAELEQPGLFAVPSVTPEPEPSTPLLEPARVDEGLSPGAGAEPGNGAVTPRAGPTRTKDPPLLERLILQIDRDVRRAGRTFTNAVTLGGEDPRVAWLVRARERAVALSYNFVLLVLAAIAGVVILALLLAVLQAAVQWVGDPEFTVAGAWDSLRSRFSSALTWWTGSWPAQAVAGLVTLVGATALCLRMVAFFAGRSRGRPNH